MTDRRRLPRPLPPTRARVATLLVFLANGSGIGGWAATIPRLKLALGLADGALGIALLCVALGAIISMPLTGRYGSRVPSHRVVALSGAIFALCLVLPGQAAGAIGLAAAGLVMGAANGVMDVSMNSHASLVERAWGSAIMSSFHAAFSLGGFLGALTVGVCARVAIGPAASLGLIGLLVLAFALASARIGLSVAVVPAPSPAPETGPDGGVARNGRGRGRGRGRGLAGLGALTFIGMLVEGSTVDWSGVFLITVAGGSVAAGSAVYGAFSIAMVAGRLLGDSVVRRLGRVATLRASATLAAAGLAVAIGVAQPEAGFVGFALVGLGVANIIPTLFSAAARARPEAPSLGVSQAATVGYTGFLIGPPAIGLLADYVGLRLALAGLPLAALLIAAQARWARER